MKRTGFKVGYWTRRDLLKSAVAAAWVVPVLGQARAGQRGQAPAAAGTQLVLLGTQGGPGITANRTQASNAVIVDGRPYLIDCGYGALKSAVQAGLTLGTISNIFIAHLHDDRVTVQAVENAYFPDRAKAKMEYRSFAYRFNTATRSIVFSGDTAYSENLIELARGADVFVCEVLGTAAGQNAPARGAAAANNNTESIARHVRETHSTPEEVGRMAAAAKVKTVVLSHQVGGGRGGNDDPLTAELKKVFSGEVVVGADQMRL